MAIAQSRASAACGSASSAESAGRGTMALGRNEIQCMSTLLRVPRRTFRRLIVRDRSHPYRKRGGGRDGFVAITVLIYRRLGRRGARADVSRQEKGRHRCRPSTNVRLSAAQALRRMKLQAPATELAAKAILTMSQMTKGLIAPSKAAPITADGATPLRPASTTTSQA